MAKILVVDDDSKLSDSVREWLTLEQHTVELAASAEEAEDYLAVSKYDVILLDWSMPGKTGIELCKDLRNRKVKTPIIMLTGNSAIEQREQGLDTGADDYLTKPFNLRELSARVRAILRRATDQVSNTLEHGGMSLDTQARRCYINEKEVILQPKEFAVLEFLMRHKTEVFSNDALIERVWKADTTATEDAIRTCMMRLRKKLADADPGIEWIETVPRVGYRFKT
ncbi:MAG: DNA-binding response regulator [Cyanobacteria bacterium PR.3.49]|nr:DNA-binding response regulator [Cyanobacteria bacterium PR.3.49]